MAATVTVALGVTINLGNFESARAEYSLTDDVRTNETQDQAFDRVEALVEQRLQSRINEERG